MRGDVRVRSRGHVGNGEQVDQRPRERDHRTSGRLPGRRVPAAAACLVEDDDAPTSRSRPPRARPQHLDLGSVQPADIDPNQYWSDAGGVSVVDSRSVEIYGLTIENYTSDGTSQVPAGIYVTTRSDTTSRTGSPHLSACFQHGGSCGDIYVIDDKVLDITNRADEDHSSKALCNNANVDAYGIAVIAAGSAASPKLQHVVVEDDTVSGTRTGQSETMTFNGAIRDFLVADNVVDDADNIGIDTIGWETGGAQASHGYVAHNTVYNIDTFSNAAYGHWDAAEKTCKALPENAAGLYDDGASYIWFGSNTVWNTDQGINLDVETPGKETDHLLVSGNVVHDDPGTSASDPSRGTNPPGRGGSSTVAGHDPFALYVDAFGAKARIFDVYVHDNVFQNESQYFLRPSDAMPVVDLGGIWSSVEIGTTRSRGSVVPTSTTPSSRSTTSRLPGRSTRSTATSTRTCPSRATRSTATSQRRRRAIRAWRAGVRATGIDGTPTARSARTHRSARPTPCPRAGA